MNHPDVVNHPAFPILARRLLELETAENSIDRQGFASRQGPLGVALGPATVRQQNTDHFYLY